MALNGTQSHLNAIQMMRYNIIEKARREICVLFPLHVLFIRKRMNNAPKRNVSVENGFDAYRRTGN